MATKPPTSKTLTHATVPDYSRLDGYSKLHFLQKSGGGLGGRSGGSFAKDFWSFALNYPINPICFMYGIFTNISPINDPNVGKYM